MIRLIRCKSRSANAGTSHRDPVFWKFVIVFAVMVARLAFPDNCVAISSSNIPLDSPLYSHLDKLAGIGLITLDVKGVRPYSRAEAARLLLEAENNFAKGAADQYPELSRQLMDRCRELIPREYQFSHQPETKPQLIDYNPLVSSKLRYLYLDGAPRSYVRDVIDPANQSAFGFIGGNLRPQESNVIHTTGTEGTPLLENNEGVIYGNGNNLDLRWGVEGYLSDKAVVLLEPQLLLTPEETRLRLHRGYVKVGGDGLELEVGRDANWFGPGMRGTTTLTNNAQNFDLIKLSSPEPLDVAWVRNYLGAFKYSFIFSRFDATGSGDTHRRPWFVGLKLALKPKPWFEIGGNLVRQEGGPGFKGDPSLKDKIFGGGDNDQINAIAGIDLRFRIPMLRNAEVYGEYAGEDSASFWPFVESYVAGIFVPCLTSSCRDDFRFEYYWGSVMAYGDFQFPAGYVYHNMTPGHSQGGAAQDFLFRYGHWFSARNNLAVEYVHTNRGKVGKTPGQVVEYKNAGRIHWRLPLHGDTDLALMYGYERIENLNLAPGVWQANQVFSLDLNYRY